MFYISCFYFDNAFVIASVSFFDICYVNGSCWCLSQYVAQLLSHINANQ